MPLPEFNVKKKKRLVCMVKAEVVADVQKPRACITRCSAFLICNRNVDDYIICCATLSRR